MIVETWVSFSARKNSRKQQSLNKTTINFNFFLNQILICSELLEEKAE